ncbi:MAG: hypothetical protein JXA69_14715 [Phycisphaerae bacterium]|nr:hypothetical protein [Phycisphaerae bacterium]
MSWPLAYAKQARADLIARNRLLERADLPQCHQLHFLQMACEKLCKAHLCGSGVDAEVLRRSHAFVESVLPVIVREHLARQTGQALTNRGWVYRASKQYARQIERLAPAVTGGGSVPSNCEYPWTGPEGAVIVPAEHNFRFDFLHERGGRTLLKIIGAVADRLIHLHSPQAS